MAQNKAKLPLGRSHLCRMTGKESVDQLREDIKHIYSKVNSLERRLSKGTGFAIGMLIILSILISGINSIWTWFK